MTVGVIIRWRRPHNLVGALLIVGATLLIIVSSLWPAYLLTSDDGGPVVELFSILVMWWGPIGILPAIFVLVPSVAVVFPDGRLPGPRWRVPFGAAVVAMVLGVILQTIAPSADPALPNPFALARHTGRRGPGRCRPGHDRRARGVRPGARFHRDPLSPIGRRRASPGQVAHRCGRPDGSDLPALLPDGCRRDRRRRERPRRVSLPDRDRCGRPALPPVRHRSDHQPVALMGRSSPVDCSSPSSGWSSASSRCSMA